MIRILLLFLFLIVTSVSWAQRHPQHHQHLLEVLQYENHQANSYPIYLDVQEGLDEAQPLHFYQYSDTDVPRLSTYYFRKSDSLITKTIHQWARFDDLFKPNKTWSHEEIVSLKNKFSNLQREMSIYYGEDRISYKNPDLSANIENEIVQWKTPLLYNPVLEYREMERENDKLGLITLMYVHQGWEDEFLKQLDFIQYYFFQKIRDKDYDEAHYLLNKELRDKVTKDHLDELFNVISHYNLELVDSKEGFSDLKREYYYIYRLTDEDSVTRYNINLAFNNHQDVIFLQYNPIE